MNRLQLALVALIVATICLHFLVAALTPVLPWAIAVLVLAIIASRVF